MRPLDLSYESDDATLTIWDGQTRQRLLIVPRAALFIPNGVDGDISFKLSGDKAIITLNSDSFKDFRTELQLYGDTIDITTRFTTTRQLEIERLDLFPNETFVNMYDLINYRNRHHTSATWPELNFGGEGFETDTTSRDWQFAPHPSMFVLRKHDVNVLFGALDLPIGNFGMFIKAQDYRIKDWSLFYGGLALDAGQTFRSPTFRMLLERGKSVNHTIERYARAIYDEGFSPEPNSRPRFSWHTEPVYCTWIDQTALAETTKQKTEDVLDEELVLKVAKLIRKERLPFKTLIIDAGWQKARGAWEPAPEKFPNFRGLIDILHDLGFKVVLWWAWAELADDVQVDPRHLMAGGKCNCHGRRVWDYSNPITQKEYLEPLLRRFFSSEPDCYDVDGIKTDFMADKIHYDMSIADPSWRGEENYFHHLYSLVDKLAREHKPDACHHAYAGHPHLAHLIDVNRTADVANTNVMEHVKRYEMLMATTPGMPIAFDFHIWLENLEWYFQEAIDHDLSVMVSNLLYTRQDQTTPWRPANSEYYKLLRQQLDRLKVTQFPLIGKD